MSIGVSTNGTVTPGSYNVNTIPFPKALGTYTDTAGTNIYLTSFIGLTQLNPFTIMIQSIFARRVRDTYSGKFL